MNTALGLDPSWKGLGWCAATDQGPVAAGHVSLDRTWRWSAVDAWLRQVLGPEVADLGLLRGADDPPPFLAIEKPPPVYTGGTNADGGVLNHVAGNQAYVGYGLGTLAGAIQLWWVQQGWLGYPWELEPREWRAWWSLNGGRGEKRGRAEKKARAIRLVESMRWGRFLEPFPRDGEDHAPCGDVAEAILMAVGAARHARDAPSGPKRPVTFLPPAQTPITSPPKSRRPRASTPDPRPRSR